ncbi:membrane-associated phospholipid phosphatase [Mycobacterium sp. MAA66]|uniref:hypothetical protein n=1 Tax=Mycobacterium sp. MAA66 TaxID=3156297 RepID=UPI003513A676
MRRFLWWWPLVGLTAMVVVGSLVGPGTTPVDQWFTAVSRECLGPHPRWMLLFNRVWVLVPLLAIAVGLTLRRRLWRTAAVMALCPLVSIIGARMLKGLFDRRWEGFLAYPSGHTTAVITVTSMLVLAVGIRWWTCAAATAFSVFGSIGMASNHFHYFTDIVGGALYATSMVCFAILAAGPDVLTRALGGTSAIPAPEPAGHPPE